ncbi:MAG: M48 family metallopeptidase, partial [Pseudomonadales bacterium]|nr:M48 family metallopeptidase [Pseudomonadales bacterium]
ELVVDDEGMVSLSVPDAIDESLPGPIPIKDMEISSRLEEVPRSLRFPDGQQFLTEDNETIDQLMKAAGMELVQTFSHRLESWIPAVVVSWFGIIVIGFAVVKWGIPALAGSAADYVPEAAEAGIGNDVIAELESRGVLEESRQPAEIHDQVTRYLEEYDDENSSILIRRSDFFGANAFALPGGKVIVTDQLIEMAETREELLAVYLHELGHLHHRHVVKQALQDSFLTLMLVTMTRDLTAATDLAAVIPTMLLSFNYSREFEAEADRYALERMQAAGVDPRHFANIVERLVSETQKDEEDWLATKYVSTHPAPEERLAMIGSWGKGSGSVP